MRPLYPKQDKKPLPCKVKGCRYYDVPVARLDRHMWRIHGTRIKRSKNSMKVKKEEQLRCEIGVKDAPHTASDMPDKRKNLEKDPNQTKKACYKGLEAAYCLFSSDEEEDFNCLNLEFLDRIISTVPSGFGSESGETKE